MNVLLALASPSASATVQVNGTGAAYPTIAQALSAASPGDTLHIGAGTYTESIVVDKDITLLGFGAVHWDGVPPALEVIFVEPGVALTLEGLSMNVLDKRIVTASGSNALVLRDVHVSGELWDFPGETGGCLHLQDPVSLTIEDSFLSGVAANHGGAVYASSASSFPVQVEDSGFAGHSTDRGGSLWLERADLTCTRCSFYSTSGEYGGAIYATLGSLHIEQSLFCRNVSGDGGAIHSSSPATIRSSRFVETRTTWQGGALYASGSTWTVENNHFLGVTAGTGVLYQRSGTLTLRNNLFYGSTGQALYRSTSGVGSVTFNGWQANSLGHANVTLDATNLLDAGDPLLVSWSADLDCSNDSLWPTPLVSPLLDAGDPSLLDPDGSISDIGAYGGPSADLAFHSDGDADGGLFFRDCDDEDPARSEDLDEICDLVDNDCDEEIDEDPVDISHFYPDCDNDGQGIAEIEVIQCFPPPPPSDCPTGTWSTASGDCDDANTDIYLGAPELCDTLDNDCDGFAEADIESLGFVDTDGDGFGSGEQVSICGPLPPGYVASGGDCDDVNAEVFPGQLEICNSLDDDCDVLVDNAGPELPWHPDLDGDGHGDLYTVWSAACRPGEEWISAGHDCDDTDASIYPGAPELCNGLDDDCSRTPDDGPVTSWFLDEDGDGYGVEPALLESSCPPEHGAALAGDCDDAASEIHPGAPEICNGIDDDCVEGTDNVGPLTTWYRDSDRDALGDRHDTVVAACPPGPDWTLDPGDCDDRDPHTARECQTTGCACHHVPALSAWSILLALVPFLRRSQMRTKLLALGFFAPVQASAVCTVNVNGAGSYSTIEAAYDAAASGDTLNVTAGPCNESNPLVVAKDLNIVGAGAVTWNGPSGAIEIIHLDVGYDLVLENLTIRRHSLTANQRVITADSANSIVMNDVDIDGDSTGEGGVLKAIYPHNIVIRGSVLAGSGTKGGAIYATGPASYSFRVEDTTFDRSTATNDGGAIWASNADLSCTRCVFQNTLGDAGGAIFATLGSLDIEQSLFCNTTGDVGGAIYSSSPATIRSSRFVETGSIGDGGALYMLDGVWEVENNHFMGVTAGSSTGTIEQAAGTLLLRNNLLYENSTVGFHRGAGTGTVSYNWWQQNTGGHASFALDSTNYADDGDPGLVSWSHDNNCANDSLWPTPITSPLLDIGDPAVQDKDGTRADIGAYGGVAAEWAGYHEDLDQDGDPFFHDCDEADELRSENQPEVCDHVDNDCDEDVDEDPVDIAHFYPDCDGDGQGEGETEILACFEPTEGPPGCAGGTWSLIAGDCDDANATIFLAAPELCDTLDNDCDGYAEIETESLGFTDTDGDGFGAGAVESFCGELPEGFVVESGDCDDGNAEVFPGQLESCNSLDDDCNLLLDDVGPELLWHPDTDGDGFGDALTSVMSTCPPAAEWLPTGEDCDDTHAAVHPSALEICNELDDNCDGEIDEGPVQVWFPDKDGDGFGNDAWRREGSCPPELTVSVGGDCDDTSASVNPGAAEVCNGIDDDCAGGVDNLRASYTWYKDADRDGLGVSDRKRHTACSPGPDWTLELGDCDDHDPNTTIECEEGCGCHQAAARPEWMVLLGLILAHRRRETRGIHVLLGRAR